MQAAQSPSFDSLVVSPSSSSEPASAVRRKASIKKLHGAIAGNGSATQEALMGLASGLAFGLVTPVVGHPGDVIKTQLQANAAHQHFTTNQTIRHIYRSQGLAGFYKGFFPPLVGTALTRGILFSTYSGVYSACSHSPLLSSEIPFSSGLGLNVVLGGVAAGSARAVVETPLEFIKVRSIVGHSAAMNGSATGASFVTSTLRDIAASPLATARHMYHGFVPTLLRSVGVCGSFFVLIDYSVRYLPDIINSPYGAFFKGGVCATAAWTLAFPFETAKSVIQADTTGQYKNRRGATMYVLQNLYRERGLVKGWYRGFVPGAGRSFVANGCSMMVYSWFQDAIRDHFDNEE